MANFHNRSISFPSQSHPVLQSFEDQINRLKSSEAASTSASSICASLDGLKVLHDGINDQIQLSSIQQALSHEQGQKLINELLEGSLRLVDLCGFSREIVQLTKESVQDLESSIRRNKGETVSSVDITSYTASRNKIKKMINKYAKDMKSFNKYSTELVFSDSNLKAIGTVLKEADVCAFSTLKSVLMHMSGAKEGSNRRSWSSLSKFMKINHVRSEVEHEGDVEDMCSLNIPKSQKGMDCRNILKQLKSSKMIIHELEEGLEALSRNLVKTRVSLLNALSH